MKRIINGKTYNVHTATTVFEDGPAISDPGGYSDAYWGLYQTRHGEFFKVKVNHDGQEILEFRPVTDAEAQALLEKYANHLVEQYFGEMPEGGAAERRLTIRIPGNLADRIESLAREQGLSLNSYAMRCFERCAAADGQPAVQG
jgi:predicted HicB family RNase H-like nuclease